MRLVAAILLKCRKYKRVILFIVLFCSGAVFVNAQNLLAYVVQDLNFGAFLLGNSGGTVVIHPNGTRSATGDIVLLNSNTPYFQAIFEVEAPINMIISLYAPDVVLTGSNGGSITLHIGNSDPTSPFVTTVYPPGRTQVSVGGTITVNGQMATIPGRYSGTVSIIFNQE